MPDWISFFDSEHSIYVNARHRAVHARLIAQGMLRHIAPGANVLDYGCGEALHAPEIASRAGTLILCEAAPHLREALKARLAEETRIAVMAPDAVARLLDASLDVVFMHSVAQYLSESEADALFALFRRLLKPQGVFVLGDILRPGVSALTDAIALLRLAAANGFFFAALIGLIRTLLSDYWTLRQSTGLTRYAERRMIEKLARAGFSAARAPENIGHNGARMTFLARPA